MNSTLESSGLSKRKSSRKFSSMGSSWANYACVPTDIYVFATGQSENKGNRLAIPKRPADDMKDIQERERERVALEMIAIT